MSTRVLLFALLTLFAAPVSAQESTEPKPLLDRLAAALKRCRDHDDDVRAEAQSEVVSTLDELLLRFPKLDPKEQAKVVKAVGSVFRARLPEDENGPYLAAAAALSEMGPAALKALLSAYKLKHIEKRPEVRAILVEAIGKHRDPKQVPFLTKLLKENENEVVVAAIRALGEYRDADVKLRKKIVEALVKEYANVNALNVREKGKNPVWRERLLAIEVPMNEALSALTLQSFETAPEWQKWWNDNRNKKW